MAKRNFLKIVCLCLISAVLCMATFAACGNSEDNSKDGSEDSKNASEELQERELTSAEFFAELKKRETASIAAKKWAKADLVIDAVIGGETKTWNVVGGEIIHKANGRSAMNFEEGSLDVFGYSTYEGQITQLQSEKYEKIGDILKCTWISFDAHDGFTETIKCTFDADGYLTEYIEAYAGEVNSESKATFSNYSGEGEFSDNGESVGGNIIIVTGK